LNASKLGNSNIFDGPSGNVGIGTTSPGATLDVNGSAVVRQNATVNGSLALGRSRLLPPVLGVPGYLPTPVPAPPAME